MHLSHHRSHWVGSHFTEEGTGKDPTGTGWQGEEGEEGEVAVEKPRLPGLPLPHPHCLPLAVRPVAPGGQVLFPLLC